LANPQIENGYTKLSNEILEIIPKAGFTAREINILLVLLRLSYGYNSKSANVSLQTFSDRTNISYKNCQKLVKSLIKNNVIIEITSNKGFRSRLLQFNKDYETWDKSISPKIGEYDFNSIPPKLGEIIPPKMGETTPPQNGGDYKEKRNIIKKPEFCNYSELIPNELRTISGFVESWGDWVKHLSDKKKPIKETTAKYQLKKIMNLWQAGNDPIEIINQSIEKNWQGFFPINQNQHPIKNDISEIKFKYKSVNL